MAHHCLMLLAGIFFLALQLVLAEECAKYKVTNCEECIKSGPGCAWCKKQNFTKAGEPDSVRCDTVAKLSERGCTSTDVINPPSIAILKENKPLGKSDTTVTQLQPQHVVVDLRPEQPKTIKVDFKLAEGYPIDLYYLMDLSFSMKDDLNNLRKLGTQILDELNRITKSARIGFGAFVDKTVLPFVNTHPEKLKNPCPDTNSPCQSPFGYRHVLSLTDEGKLFKAKVTTEEISGNLDAPEGGLDAMMQAAVCGDKIGWRNVTRLLLLATDDGFHFAGDGKLAAILTPNDGECHLTNNEYTKSTEFDYPSVAQLAQKLEENNIQPIFAVTKKMVPTYQALSKLIPKSAVGELSDDSSNVVQLIKEAYNNLRSQVILEHKNLPNDITITYDSDCGDNQKKSQREPKGRCDNVQIDQQISFNVTITATRCFDNPQTVEIRPLGFTESLKVTVSTRCKCECDEPGRKDDCGGNGNIVCGICSCKKGFLGKNCECRAEEKTTQDLESACRRDNSSAICSNAGECICGTCSCHGSDIQGKQIYGTYCECDNMNCELNNGRLCGGNGKCDCGTCKCNEEYEGSACQCKKSIKSCLNSRNNVCSGRGTCVCDICQCTNGYQPPFCETCPGCAVPCAKYALCIECEHFKNEKNTEKCKTVNCTGFTANIVESLGKDKMCKEKDSVNCFMSFTLKENDGFDSYSATVLKDRECPQPPNIVAIVGGTIAGVALIGLLLLILWKVVTEIYDRREYHRFEKEKQKAKWDTANPLFKSATTVVVNPHFSSE
ncbi:integrin beta-2-like isoform X2 [Protopterus annectens]|nr:integrin beta-2-like isoform X2 [Protopterus annectens]XP_043931049.1 integrin beta-2-like isoform X2 [Protopterus annectens]XP_043931051.1 integrin beta-2-like isoform X2 [Protopterus annectens]XP_043931052.1 integrin beta-2-like isoform X2 [Protopterus annectens]